MIDWSFSAATSGPALSTTANEATAIAMTTASNLNGMIELLAQANSELTMIVDGQGIELNQPRRNS
jgi:hypothetical protein